MAASPSDCPGTKMHSAASVSCSATIRRSPLLLCTENDSCDWQGRPATRASAVIEATIAASIISTSPAVNVPGIRKASQQTTKPGACPGFSESKRVLLPVESRSRVVLRHNFLGILSQRFRLRQQLKALHHLRIGFRANFQTFVLSESIHENLRLDARFDPVGVVDQVSLRVCDIGFVERLAEFLHCGVVHFEALRWMMRHDIALGKVEERVVLEQRVLEVICLDRRDRHIGSDSSAAINGTSAVRQLHLAV